MLVYQFRHFPSKNQPLIVVLLRQHPRQRIDATSADAGERPAGGGCGSGGVDEGGTVSLDASKLFANDTDVDSETLTMTKVGDGESGRVLLDGVTMPLLGCGWAIPEPSET